MPPTHFLTGILTERCGRQSVSFPLGGGNAHTRIASEYSGQFMLRQGAMPPRRTCDVPPVDRRPRRASCHHGNLARPGAADPTPSQPSALAAASICLEPCRARAGHRLRGLGYSREARDADLLAFAAGDPGIRRPLLRSRPPVDPTRAATRAPAKTSSTRGHGEPFGKFSPRWERGGTRKSARSGEHPAERAAAAHHRGRSAGAWRDGGPRPDRSHSAFRLHPRSRACGDARVPGTDNQRGAVQTRARPAARARGRDRLGMSGASGFSHQDHGAVRSGRGVRGGYER